MGFFNSDIHQFHQYQQNEQLPPILTQMTTTDGNPGSGLGPAQSVVGLNWIRSNSHLVCSVSRLIYLYNIWRCITSEIGLSTISMNHLDVISQSYYTISFIKLLLTLVHLDPCFSLPLCYLKALLNYTVIYTINSQHLHSLSILRLEDFL